MIRPRLRSLWLALMISGLCALGAGCGQSTYPREIVEKSVHELCLREYGMKDVTAKLNGRTIGVHMSVDNLFEGMSGFRKEAMDKVEDVLLVVRRVCLSSDAGIEFFNLFITDRATNLQVSLIGYVLDIKMAIFGAISRNDYSQRMRLTAVADTYQLAKGRVEKLFQFMSSKKMSLSFLAANFNLLRNSGALTNNYLLSLLESRTMETSSNAIRELRCRAEAPDRMVFYVRAVENYTPPPPGSEQAADQLASGAPVPASLEYEFLIWVKVESYNSSVDRVYPLSRLDAKTRKLVPNPLGEDLLGYADFRAWPEYDFFVADISFNQFLADQIAQRVRAGIVQLEDNKLLQNLLNIEGRYADGFEIVFKSKDKEAITQMMIDVVVKTVQEVCRSYRIGNSPVMRIRDRANAVVFQSKI